MSTNLPSDVFVPVPLRWRHVAVGDVFISGRTGELWSVVDGVNPCWLIEGVTVQRGTRKYTSKVDPDDMIQVLVPVPERDAIDLTREVLGARLVERRTAPPHVED